MAESEPTADVQQLLSSSKPIVIAPAAGTGLLCPLSGSTLLRTRQVDGGRGGGRGSASAAPRPPVQVGAVPGASAAPRPPVQEPEVGVPVAAASPLSPVTGPAITASNRVLGKKAPQSGYHVRVACHRSMIVRSVPVFMILCGFVLS